MNPFTQNLIPYRDEITKFLEAEITDWLTEVTPGETQRNSEIAFYCGELKKLIQKLNPAERQDVKAPSMR